jgi:adenylate cyclase
VFRLRLSIRQVLPRLPGQKRRASQLVKPRREDEISPGQGRSRSRAIWRPLWGVLWPWRGPLVAVPLVTLGLWIVRSAGGLQPIEFGLWDAFTRIQIPVASRILPDPRILIVGVNERDIQTLKRWPVPDQTLAQVIGTLKQHQPAAIGLDLYRDFPVEPGHAQLQALFQTTPNLIGIEKMVGDRLGGAVSPPEILAKQQQVAANDLLPDFDGRLRRGLLYLEQGDRYQEGLGLRLALIYLERAQIYPNPSDPELVLGRTRFPPLPPEAGGYVNADPGGYQILLRYRGGKSSFLVVSLQDVLENRVPSSWIRDRIVLVGTMAASINDHFYTPYSTSTSHQMVGVEVHAHLSSQILRAVLDREPLIQVWPKAWEYGYIALWSGLGALLSWQWYFRRPLLRAWWWRGLLLMVGGSLGMGLAYGAFHLGWWLPAGPALLAFGVSYLAIAIYGARSASELRNTFGRYLSDDVVTNLLETPGGLRLGGQRRQVTLLMADLRGFSTAVEQHPPEQVLTWLNRYLAAMTEVVTHYQGTIDELMGDGMLVIFGAPHQRQDDAQRAVACALAMQQALAQFSAADPKSAPKGPKGRKSGPKNAQKNVASMPSLSMGIGIHTGEVIVGNIGSHQRSKYGIVGSAINLTARIERYTIGGQILISEATQRSAAAELLIASTLVIQPKGFEHSVRLLDVRGMSAPYQLTLPLAQTQWRTLPQPLRVACQMLQEKYVSPQVFWGEVHRVSLHLIEVKTNYPLEPLQDIKLNVLPPGLSEGMQAALDALAQGQPLANAVHPALYGKVQSILSLTQQRYLIALTTGKLHLESLQPESPNSGI